MKYNGLALRWFFVCVYGVCALCVVSACSDSDDEGSSQTSSKTSETSQPGADVGETSVDAEEDSDGVDADPDIPEGCVVGPEGAGARLEAPVEREDERVCSEESADVWTLFLRRSEVLTVEMENRTDGGDLDLVLIEEADGREVATSRTAEAVESIVYEVRRDGVYAVRVEPFEESPGRQDLGYALRVDRAEPLSCDAFLEPNDSVQEAYMLLRQGSSEAAQSRVEAAVCVEDRDVFAIEATASEGAQLILQARTDVFYGSAHLTLSDAQGVELGAAEPDAEGNMTLRARLPAAGTFFATLEHREGSHVPYSLDAMLTPAVRCSDDEYEPNDRRADAPPWDTAQDIAGVACSDDPDVFALLPTPGRFNAWGFSLTWVGDTPPTFSVEDSIGRVLSESRRDDEGLHAVWGTDTSQPTFVHIEHDQPAEPTPYVLTATHIVAPEGFDCEEVVSNDTPEDATPISAPEMRSGALCSSQDPADIYRVELEQGQVLNARVEFNPSFGDMDLILTDETGQVTEGSSRTRFAFEEIILAAPRTASYLLHIVPVGPVAAPYLLNVQTLDAPACEDAFEPNNSPTTAVEAPSPIQSLHVCAEDPDFFRIPVEHDRAFIEVSVAHNGLFGDVDLRLLDLDETPLGATLGIEANFIQAAVDAPGDYTAEVRAALGTVIPYEVVWNVVRRPACDEDPFEPNNETPTPLTAPARGAIVCDSDVDLYTVHVQQPNSTLAVILDPTLSLGFAQLDILAPDGVTVLETLNRIPPGSETEHGGHSGDERPEAQLIHIFQPIDTPGSYTLRVSRVQGDDVVYDLIAAELPTPTCPSALEPNDKPIDATPLSDGITSNLVYCPSQPTNPDYFSIQLDAFETLDILALYDSEGPDMVLIAPDGETQLLEAFSARGDIELQYVAPEAGTYYLLVTAVAPEPFPYSLSIERR